MKTLYSLFLSLSLLTISTYAQPDLSEVDFKIGHIAIDSSLNLALPELGKLIVKDSIEDEEVQGFNVYYFDGVTIWVEKKGNTISSFDISSSRYVTHRGLQIGDPVSKLERLYGEAISEKELNRIHDNYDTGFRNFTEIKIYEYRKSDNDVFYAIFYIKDSKVVKMYMYRGLGC